MVSRHRKLLNESSVDPVLAKFCESDCNDYGNPDGFCSSDCINYCPSVCKFSVIEIPPPPPTVIQLSPSVKSHRLSLLLTASLAVLAAAFFLFTCYTIYRLYSNFRTSRRRRQLEEDAGPDDLLEDDLGPAVDHPIWYIRTVGLQPSVIGAITIVRYNKGEGLIDGTDCSVCLNEFQENETLRLLPKCNHAFHVPCVDTWLRSHTNCPLCRAGIMSNPAVLSSQTQNSQIPGPNLVEETQELSGRINRRITDMVELESESIESRVRIQSRDETVSRARNGSKANEGLLDGIQPMKRSISVDSLSCIATNRNLDNRLLVESKESTHGVVGFNRSLLRLVGNRLIERAAQTGSSSMKRSLSCNGNVSVSMQGSMNPNEIPQELQKMYELGF